MGPHGSLWLTLEEVRTGKSDANVDLFECLKLVEQSITLIGQAKVSLTYERRLAILYRLTGDVKKAKKLLSKHESSLLDSHKALFGNKFYKALRKATKLGQASKEISNHVGAFRNKQQGSSGNRSRSTSKAMSSGKDYQPFRKTPPSQQRGRGGGRSVSFRGKTNCYPKGKSIVIKFTRTTRSPESKLHRNQTFPASKHVHCNKSGSSAQSDCPKKDSSCYCKSSNGYIHFKTIPPLRRKIKTFPEQLEVINTGPIHSTNCNWGSDTIRKIPNTENCSISSISQPTGDGTNSQRDTIYVRKSCNSGGPSTKQRVYKLSVSSSQEGWGEQTHNKSQLFYNLSTFQNGRVTPFKTGTSEGRSYDKDRFERCLLLCAYTPKASPFLEIYVGGETLSVQLPSFWSSTSTLSLHQIVEASGSPVAQTGFKADCLPGRYNSFQSNSRRVFTRQGHHTLASSTFGICHKLEKICANPNPNNGIPGVSDQLLGNDIIITRGENAESDPILQATAPKQGFISERNSQDSGEIDLLYAGNSPCPLTLQTSADVADKESVGWQVLRDRGDSESELQGGPSVVDRSNHQLEWSCYKYSSPRPSNNYGRFLKGLGGSLSGHSYQGSLVPTGGLPSHKCPGIDGCTVCCESIHSKQNTFAHTSEDGQQNCNCLYFENGGHTINSPTTNSSGVVGVCSEQFTSSREYLPGVLNSEADWESRHFQDSSDWKLNPSIFKTLNQLWGPLEVDLFASRINCQLRNYVSWFPDPFAMATDAFQLSWTNLKGYSFPPFVLICQCLAKIRSDQATLVIITPTWPTQVWYPVLLEMSCRDPILIPPMGDLLTSPSCQVHPLVKEGSLSLAAWMVSGKISLQKAFQNTLPNYSAPTHGAKAPKMLTTAPGHSGVAGVFKGKLIHFAPLWPL